MKEWMRASEIAKELGIHPDTVYRLQRRHSLSKKEDGRCSYFKKDEILASLLIAKSANPYNKRFLGIDAFKDYSDFWSLDWNDFIVASDIHVPFIHSEAFELMLKVAKKFHITNFLHGGDFWDQGFASKFTPFPEDLVSWDEELDVGRKVIAELKKVFKNIYFISGSHDLRVWTFFAKENKHQPWDLPWKLAGEDGINVSRYRYAEISGYWRITHPKNVVRIGQKPSTDLCAKFGKSLIIGHGHWWGIDQDFSGKYYLVFPGCLADGNKIDYKNLWDTSHKNWKNGFVVVRNKYIPDLYDIPKAKFVLGEKEKR